jgi:hypothetical protein
MLNCGGNSVLKPPRAVEMALGERIFIEGPYLKTDCTKFNQRMRLWLLLVCVALAACSTRYRIEFFNESGAEIDILESGRATRISHRDSVVLFDSVKDQYRILPHVLKIRGGESELCYYLNAIDDGGYGEHTESDGLLVRLKLETNGNIYVYRISESGFHSDQAVGIQPDGYPASPEACL